MASISTSNFIPSYSAKTICQIVGLTCLAGFFIDMLALGLPPDPLSLEWRIGFLQQVGDRSIILLFGAALTMYGSLDKRRLIRQLALFCLVIGILFQLSSVLIVRDGLVLKQQTISNINNQATQLQTQIRENQDSPSADASITPEQLRQASQLVSSQASSLKQNAQTTIAKAGLATVGNLVVVGIGLIGLGRFGIRLRKG